MDTRVPQDVFDTLHVRLCGEGPYADMKFGDSVRRLATAGGHLDETELRVMFEDTHLMAPSEYVSKIALSLWAIDADPMRAAASQELSNFLLKPFAAYQAEFGDSLLQEIKLNAAPYVDWCGPQFAHCNLQDMEAVKTATDQVIKALPDEDVLIGLAEDLEVFAKFVRSSIQYLSPRFQKS